MAVAMEVAAASWSTSPVRKKRAWGADAQQLMQLMMGQLQQSSSSSDVVKPVADELTLDLFGKADPPATASQAAVVPPKSSESPEFLHLDPEDSAPLPSGWEKCLDLQTGKLYYVNKSSGVSSFNDPRKRINRVEVELQTQVDFPFQAHEFLGSKKSETLRQQESLRAGCSSSSSGGSPRPISSRLPPSSFSFPNGKLWTLQRNDRHKSSSCSPGVVVEDDSNLELDLNLAAGGRSSGHQLEVQQTVCTMEMIQNFLKRSSEQTSVKREMPRLLRLKKASVSSSFSSLTNSATTRSEPNSGGAGGGASPSTSSSSTSASSRSSLLGAAGSAPKSNPSTTGVCEAESIKVENTVEPGSLVMGACTRCLMYVMLNKADPRCPRCESKVPVDFAPPCKKQLRAAAGGLQLGFGSSSR